MHYATDKNTIVLKKKNACHYASDKNTLDLSWEKKNQIFLAPPPPRQGKAISVHHPVFMFIICLFLNEL